MLQATITYTDGTRAALPLLEEKTARGFRVTLPRTQVTKPAEFADFMVGYAPAYEGEDGYIIVNNHRVKFFGHQDGVMDAGYCRMPLLGVKTPRECFACIVTGLSAQHSFIVAREQGVYTAHLRFRLEGQPIEEDMQAEFCLLTGAEADYNGMAAAYRAHQLTVGGCKLIRDRMNEDLAYVLDAPEVRIRQAWKPVPTPVEEQTPETEPPMHVAATFERVGQLLDACKAQGVDKAEFCLIGWNIRGHDGRWPQAFPVEEALGGEEGLRSLIRKGQEMGYRMVCHTNSTDCFSIADRWTEELPMRTRTGEKQRNNQWGGGRMYNMCPVAGGEAFAQEDLPRIRELGFKGIHYIDVITTAAPRRCFSQKHPCSPKQFVDAMHRIAVLSQKLFGGFHSEGGYDYLADVTDMALCVDFGMLNPYTRRNPLVDDHVPMWELVYHGIILGNPAPATVNYPVKDWEHRLKFMEYGGHPVIYVHSKFHDLNSSMGNVCFTCGSQQEIEETAAGIRQMLEDYRPIKDLQLEQMVRHETFGDLAVVTYEGGAQVVCNYAAEPAVWRGHNVPAHDFTVIRPA